MKGVRYRVFHEKLDTACFMKNVSYRVFHEECLIKGVL